MASEGPGAAGYAPAYWAGPARDAAGTRQYVVRLAAPSEGVFRDALDRLRWEVDIDILWCDWAEGEGEARVECWGDVATVLDALRAAGQEGALLAAYRA